MNNLEKLKTNISQYSKVIIAFSGGVDSTFLAKISKDTIGPDNVLLITATSSTYPFYELEESKKIAKDLKISQEIIVSEEIDIPGFADNPPDRCYYCKGELFKIIRKIAETRNYDAVFDGSNADDINDYRPGMKALKEQKVKSPLMESGMGKTEIRRYSKKLGLATASKQSYACLASRFPYGEKITTEKLDRIGKAEFELRKMGFSQFRIRNHEDLARIELDSNEITEGFSKKEQLIKICKNAGFNYVALDLEGYRTGSMNETLKNKKKT